MLADVSEVVNLPSDHVDREIVDAQRRVCEFLGLDISTVWQWAPERPDTLLMTHIYRRLPGPPTPDSFDAQKYFPWALQQLRAGKTLAISSLRNVPAEAKRDLEVWRHFGLKTVLNLPLVVGGGPPLGLICFNDTETEREWTDALVQRLQLVGQVFANALARKRAEQELRESAERLSSIYNTVADVVFYVGVEGDRAISFYFGQPGILPRHRLDPGTSHWQDGGGSDSGAIVDAGVGQIPGSDRDEDHRPLGRGFRLSLRAAGRRGERDADL